MSELRERPTGTVRITVTENATEAVLLPKLAPLLREYPDIRVEIITGYGLTDIVDQRHDAGVRSAEQVAKGMIAVRIGPDMRMAIVRPPLFPHARGAEEVNTVDGRRRSASPARGSNDRFCPSQCSAHMRSHKHFGYLDGSHPRSA